MCREHVHQKAVEVFKDILHLVESLRESKRKEDQEFQGDIRFMVRKMYGLNHTLNYLIFVVKADNAPYCLSAWEISAAFKEPGEELFYFIKSKMLLNSKTSWITFPLFLRKPIVCQYDHIDNKDFAFLESTTALQSGTGLNKPIQDLTGLNKSKPV